MIRVMGEGDDRILVEEVVDHIVSALGQAPPPDAALRAQSHRCHYLMVLVGAVRAVVGNACSPAANP